MCGHQTLVVYLCVSECICVSAVMLSTGWHLVLSQSADGSTIIRKPLRVQSAMLHNNIKWPYQSKHIPSCAF